jgi:hypothetical protein
MKAKTRNHEESYVVCGDGPYVSSLFLVARCGGDSNCARFLPLLSSQLWLNVTLGL